MSPLGDASGRAESFHARAGGWLIDRRWYARLDVSPQSIGRARVGQGRAYIPGKDTYRTELIYSMPRDFRMLRIREPVQVTIEFFFAKPCRGDLDNLAKPILDALVVADILAGDTISEVPQLVLRAEQAEKDMIGIMLCTLQATDQGGSR